MTPNITISIIVRLFTYTYVLLVVLIEAANELSNSTRINGLLRGETMYRHTLGTPDSQVTVCKGYQALRPNTIQSVEFRYA